MRLIPRHRQQRRARQPQIAISQAEITADLHYPAHARRAPAGYSPSGTATGVTRES